MLVRIGRQGRQRGLERVEQAADFVRGELLMRRLADGRDHLAMDGGAAGRHVDLLVPFKQGGGALQIDDFGDREVETIQGILHEPRIPEATASALLAAHASGHAGQSQPE